jgi:hypothetical protein
MAASNLHLKAHKKHHDWNKNHLGPSLSGASVRWSRNTKLTVGGVRCLPLVLRGSWRMHPQYGATPWVQAAD